MKTILIVNSKGGVSKTSLSISLAQCINQQGGDIRACLLDSDPQGSIRNFAEFIGVDIVDKLDNSYTYNFVDTAPYLNSKTSELIKKADYVLIPCRPNYIDAVALGAIVPFLKGKKAGIVLVQTQHRVNISEVLETLKTYEIPILEQSMSYRVSYARVTMQNLFTSEDSKAQREIFQIMISILSNI